MCNRFFKATVCCLFAALVCITATNAQTIFSIGNQPVSVKELIASFSKNPVEGNQRKALADYLPMYINYKLKVRDARAKQMDTLPEQIQERNGYREQLIESHLNAKAGAEALAKEAINRMQQEVLLGHLFIGFPPSGDSSIALKNAQAATTQLSKGIPWKKVADAFSIDTEVSKNHGIVGWITCFSIPYPYETLVYGLRKGQWSQPIAASGGYHIFYKADQRPANGLIEVAQILLPKTTTTTADEERKIAQLADSLHLLLQKGAAIGPLAVQFSADPLSRNQGGLLPPFGVGTYDPVFENVVFALNEKNKLSTPFTTDYGYHIVQFIKRQPLPNSNNDADVTNFKSRVVEEGRLILGREQYVEKQLPALKYERLTVSNTQLQQYTDSIYQNGNLLAAGLVSSAPLMRLGKAVYTMADWTTFIRVQQNAKNKRQLGKVAPLYDVFVKSKAEDYLRSNLETIDAEFAERLQEFEDANLLFFNMDAQVWSKAPADSVGLLSYYKQHASKYTWGENAHAIFVNGNDTLALAKAREIVTKDVAQWRSINTLFEGKAMADSNRFEWSMLPVTKETTAGIISKITQNAFDNSYSFVAILTKNSGGDQRTFEEAKGFVINDYQQVLENAWMSTLRRKYPVKINEAVWKQLLAKY